MKLALFFKSLAEDNIPFPGELFQRLSVVMGNSLKVDEWLTIQRS